jgi:protein subunit release factor B
VFPVSAEKERALTERLERLGVRPADLEERFVRSSGHGGQNVNKVATCVVLRHLPTGLTVKCQEARTQAMNRFLARRLLCERIEEQREGRASATRQRAEKIRRQKRRRSRRAKQKMLDDKHRHSEKKTLRRAPGGEED